MRRYYPGITIFKLAGCLLVLLGHAMLIRYVQLVPSQKLKFLFYVPSIVVPCFYVIAGFLAYRGWANASNPGSYVQKYLTRLLILYSFFCLIFIAQFVVPALINNGLSPDNLFLQLKIVFMMIVLNGPFIQLWFIPPLIFGISASFWFCQRRSLRLALILGLAGLLACQFVSGSLKGVLASAAGAGGGAFLDLAYVQYLILFLTRYVGFGFMFVLAGVILARHEEKFLKLNVWTLLAPSAALTIVETLLLIRFSEWDSSYKLSFCILPNAILLFYGILRVKSQTIQSWHKPINLFSIVTYFGHIVFMSLNLFMLNWERSEMNIFQDIVFVLLTLFECLAVTMFLVFRGRRVALREGKKLAA